MRVRFWTPFPAPDGTTYLPGDITELEPELAARVCERGAGEILSEPLTATATRLVPEQAVKSPQRRRRR